MNEHEDTQFERRASELLRSGIADTDGATRARLSHARAAAVEAAARRPAWIQFRYLAPVGAVAGTAVAAVLLFGKPAAPVNAGTVAALSDMDLLSDAEAFDIAQESDLGFIEWAATQGESGG